MGVHWQAQFEWYAHEKLARKAGVAEAALPLIRAGAPPAALEGVLQPDELVVYELAQELMTTRRVSAATFAAAKQVLKRARLMHATHALHARCMHAACTLHARCMYTACTTACACAVHVHTIRTLPPPLPRPNRRSAATIGRWPTCA